MINNGSQESSDFISEINVTPLVDVVLVLLIIFMISAPLLMNHIDLKLPKTKKVQKLSNEAKNVTISLDRSGQLYFDKNRITLEKLPQVIKERQGQGTPNIFLRADENTDYKFVARTLAVLKNANLSQISLVTETESK